MSQIDNSENILSETKDDQNHIDSLKLVPVAESIRYRKRAQAAEKANEELVEKLAETKSQASELAGQLNSLKVEHELAQKLVTAGAVDLETAVLLAKSRMEDAGDIEIDNVIKQLKNEKRYLFENEHSAVSVGRRTSGAKGRECDGQVTLVRAAKKAATTGNRTDLQEYLRLRRQFV